MAAELAAALPAVALVLAACLGGVGLVARQVVLADAAAGAARALARGEDESRARGLVERAAPRAAVGVERDGDYVCVRLRERAPFAALPIDVTARSCALDGGW
ncbi:TadE family type IV pilus minor pilin [Agromyces sp. SYSU T00194]|uniref:TadE family type IV pilus minor pilin n=1 Tax=Agromyces chitinivorans TaxID=3158560 RepID=UPI00339751B7